MRFGYRRSVGFANSATGTLAGGARCRNSSVDLCTKQARNPRQQIALMGCSQNQGHNYDHPKGADPDQASYLVAPKRKPLEVELSSVVNACDLPPCEQAMSA